MLLGKEVAGSIPVSPTKRMDMTREEFNEKWRAYIPKGWSGLEFDIEGVAEYLDEKMPYLISIKGFAVQQIKLKFGRARVYMHAEGLDDMKLIPQLTMEEHINKLVKREENKRKHEDC